MQDGFHAEKKIEYEGRKENRVRRERGPNARSGERGSGGQGGNRRHWQVVLILSYNTVKNTCSPRELVSGIHPPVAGIQLAYYYLLCKHPGYLLQHTCRGGRVQIEEGTYVVSNTDKHV